MDWSDIAGVALKFVNQGYTQAQAQKMAEEAYAKAQANLDKTRADFDAIQKPTYNNLVPEQLPGSALKDIQVDARGQQGQEQAMAELQQLVDAGGLSLSDMAALKQLQGNLSQADSARRKSLSNQYAARGQLGSGAQLGIELQGQQDTAQSAAAAGEATAGMAQKRALDAILAKAGIGRQMTGDKYGRDSDAAKAADLIAQRNAAARTDSAKYNNTIAGQGFDDSLGLAKAKAGLTGAENALTMDKAGTDSAREQAYGKARDTGIDTVTNAWSKFGGGSSAPSDSAPSAPPMVQAEVNDWDDPFKKSPSKLGDDDEEP